MKPLTTSTLALAILAAVSVGACSVDMDPFDLGHRDIDGSGRITSVRRDIGDFSAIALYTEGTVEVTVGSGSSIEIETDDNLHDHIATELDGGVLKLSTTEPGLDLDPTDGIIYRVSHPSLTGIDLHGAGRFQIDGVAADRLRVSVPGAGSVEIDDLQASALELNVSGAGNVDIRGSVDRQEVEWLGVGDYDGSELRSAHTDVRLDGAGHVTVWATDTLEAVVNGAGSIEYRGDPEAHTSVNGLGRISQGGLE